MSSIDMVRVEGGSFDMGSISLDRAERPVHRVTVSSFYISKYVVTQKLYSAVMGKNPSRFSGEDNPVVEVTWFQAVKFANALSTKDGLNPVFTKRWSKVTADWSANGYRLPTEAEWEYAARGGNKSRGYEYAGSNTVDEVAWYWENSGNITHPVGCKKANELGLYDMSGNVDEWVWDWYDSYYYNFSPGTDPRGPAIGANRVIRGGCCNYFAMDTRLASRGACSPSTRYSKLGFRLLRSIVQ